MDKRYAICICKQFVRMLVFLGCIGYSVPTFAEELGLWSGKISGPNGEFPISMTVGQDSSGKYIQDATLNGILVCPRTGRQISVVLNLSGFHEIIEPHGERTQFNLPGIYEGEESKLKMTFTLIGGFRADGLAGGLFTAVMNTPTADGSMEVCEIQNHSSVWYARHSTETDNNSPPTKIYQIHLQFKITPKGGKIEALQGL